MSIATLHYARCFKARRDRNFNNDDDDDDDEVDDNDDDDDDDVHGCYFFRLEQIACYKAKELTHTHARTHAQTHIRARAHTRTHTHTHIHTHTHTKQQQ